MERILIGLGILFLAAAAAAQSIDHAPGTAQHSDGAPLTLTEALDEALAKSPSLSAVRLEYEAMRQKRRQEGFLAPPTLEAEVWQWPLTTVNPLDTNMYMFTMRQDLPGRGKRALRGAFAERAVDLAANDISIRAREVIAQVARAYAELAFARQAITIHLQHVDLLRQTADLVMARYSTGRGGQQDALKAVAEISRLHGDLIALEERAQIAASELNALLNRDPRTPIGAVAIATALPTLPAVADLQRVALAQHPELRGAALEIDRAQAGLDVANGDYKPDFMVMGGYQLMPRTAGAWTASVGITWPGAPWARGGLDAKKAEAAASVDVAKAKQRETANTVRLAVQQAYIHAAAAADRAQLLQASVVPQLQQVLEASRIAYTGNRGDAASVIESQRMVLDAQLAYYEALSDAALARVDLEHAVGVDLSSLLPAPREVAR